MVRGGSSLLGRTGKAPHGGLVDVLRPFAAPIRAWTYRCRVTNTSTELVHSAPVARASTTHERQFQPRRLGGPVASRGRQAGADESDAEDRLSSAVAESIEQFSYELTANALAEQERAVAALRMRAGTILAAASIAGSFLTTKAGDGSLDGWAIAALVTFALCLASAVWVLFPHEFVFAVRGKALLAETDRFGVRDVAEAYRAASIWIEPYLDRNREQLSRMSGWFTVSCVLLAAEVVLWELQP